MTASLALTTALVLATVSHGAIGDIKIDNQKVSKAKAGVGHVIFPHSKHEKLNKCSDCHPKIFAEKAGTNKITMKANMEGKFCGSVNCHNSPKAFPLYQCAKCHTNVKGAAK